MNIATKSLEAVAPLFSHIANKPEVQKWVDTIPGESLSVRVRSEDVDNRFTIMDTICSPGSQAPLHYHAEDEIFRVLEGVMTFALANEIVEAGPGSVIVIPAKTPHSFRNYTSEPVRLTATFIPGGIERMFEQMAGKGPEEVHELAQAFGTVIIGPPLPDRV